MKCPFSKRDMTLEQAITEDSQFCLAKVNGQYKLRVSHKYYYQVQTQMACTGRNYCDFCLWSTRELFSERILFSKDFFLEAVNSVRNFYELCVHPELLGRYFTERQQPVLVNVSNNPCFCKANDETKTIILCSNVECPVKQFHKECLGLKNKPKSGWHCPTCRVTRKAQKK